MGLPHVYEIYIFIAGICLQEFKGNKGARWKPCRSIKQC